MLYWDVQFCIFYVKRLNIPVLSLPIGNSLFGKKSNDKFTYKCYLRLILEKLNKIPILYCMWIFRIESFRGKVDYILFLFKLSVPK